METLKNQLTYSPENAATYKNYLKNYKPSAVGNVAKNVWNASPFYNPLYMPASLTALGAGAINLTSKIPMLGRLASPAAKLRALAGFNTINRFGRVGSITPALAYGAWTGKGGAIDQLKGYADPSYSTIADASLAGGPSALGATTSNVPIEYFEPPAARIIKWINSFKRNK